MKTVANPLLNSPDTTKVRKNYLARPCYLRELYTNWYNIIIKNLPKTSGLGLELGSGGGFFKELAFDFMASDVMKVPGVDKVIDASTLPFCDQSIRAIVGTNVLHHLPEIRKFLKEADRVLWTGIVVATSMLLVAVLPIVWPKNNFSAVHYKKEVSGTSAPWWFSIFLFVTAVLCDMTATHRTVSTTTYGHYHIYSMGFYLLAAVVGVGHAGKTLQPMACIAAPLSACFFMLQFLAATIFSQKIFESPTLKSWGKQVLASSCIDPPNPVFVVWYVSPEFGKLTGQSFEALRDYLLQQKNAK